ncbi:MAG: hypothetical protein MZW92_68880 [Comamonadaceae bacterium]|nr:hypothetical protein [Comamonadaceae bacterium]
MLRLAAVRPGRHRRAGAAVHRRHPRSRSGCERAAVPALAGARQRDRCSRRRRQRLTARAAIRPRYAEAARRAMPAVVSVYTTKEIRQLQGAPGRPAVRPASSRRQQPGAACSSASAPA